MGLLALAIAPGIAICLFIYYKDKYNKEPIWMLILAFLLGVLSIIPAGIAETIYTRNVPGAETGSTLGIKNRHYIGKSANHTQ